MAILLSYRQDFTHGLCYISCEVVAGSRNSSMGPPGGIDLTTYHSTTELGNYKKKTYLLDTYVATSS